jgi:hypothetical protein
MPITRDPSDYNKLIDHVAAVNEIDRQHNVIDDSMIDMRATSQDSVIFDIHATETTLLPATERGSRESTYGSDNTVDTRAFPVSFFKTSDRITQQDVFGMRRYGTPEGVQTVDLARAEKLEKLRRQADQTDSYMRMKAAFTGQCVSPDGSVFADMKSELGVTTTPIDLVLGTATTDLQTKLREIKRAVRAGLTNGGFFNGISIYMNPDMYDRFIAHDSMKDAYKYFAANAGNNLLRDDVTDMFRTGGITFYSVDGSFKLPTGSSEDLVADNTAYVVPNVEGLIRGYYGASDKLSHANVESMVAPYYAFEYQDGRDESIEMQLQMSRLYVVTQPGALQVLTSSN